MSVKRIIISVFIFIGIFLFVFCRIKRNESFKDSISVMNWNLETFFDAQFDGNEYKEFQSEKYGWSKDKYIARLDKLTSVIKELDCDVVIMEEIEKKEQLFDISNKLCGTFDSSKLYKYGYFTCEEGASIGCGILSRFPISDVKVHSVKVNCSKKQPSMRPIIQFSIKNDKKELVFFVNHWKSKSGGEKESDFWRDYQEKQLSRLIKDSLNENKSILACGDFNRSIEEFFYKKNGKFNIVLKGGTCVYSPWFDECGNLSEIGSYFFKDSWEYIDNFFCANSTIKDFISHNSGKWVDFNGHPNKYKIYSGEGYSDHLPITCNVEF